MKLTIEEKELIHIMVDLWISKETVIAIGLLLGKRGLGAESLKELNPKEINDEKTIDLALNLK